VADQDSALDLVCKSEPSREAYYEFVAGMLSGGFIPFFGEYAALGRRLASSAELWVETTVELLQRFHQDRHAICDAFGITGDPIVDAVESAASDPHNGQRAVCILRLESGERVVYKPRPIAVETLWNDLLKFCGDLGAPVRLLNLRTLDKVEYGWTEYVRGSGCSKEE
jgi:lantibiotic modifying enzyme